METKELFALAMLPVVIVATAGVATLSHRARDCVFLLLVAGAVVTHRLDVNFLGLYWYRGTTRGFEVSFLDVLAVGLLMASLLRPRPGQPRWYWSASLGFMLLYFLYCGVSVLISEPRIFGMFELSKVMRGILVFVAVALYVRTGRELGLLVFALACAVCLEGALALKQRYLDGVYRVTGTIEHPNSLSMYLCMAGPVLVAAANADWSRWLRGLCYGALVMALIAMLLTVSRAGIPIFLLVTAGTAVWCSSWRPSPGRMAMAGLCVAGVAILIYGSWDTLSARYGQASFEEEYLEEGTEGRGVYLRWAGSMVDDHFFGVGLNNWSYWVSKVYGPERGFPYLDYDDLMGDPLKEELPDIHLAAPAHSLAALTVGELGVPGLLLFGLLWLRWFQMGAVFLFRRVADPMRRLGVGILFGTGGVFLQSVTEWTYRQTAIFFTFNVLLGALAGLYQQRRRTGGREAARVEHEEVRECESEEMTMATAEGRAWP